MSADRRTSGGGPVRGAWVGLTAGAPAPRTGAVSPTAPDRPAGRTRLSLWSDIDATFASLVLGLAIRLPVSMMFGNPYDFEIWRTYSKLVWAFHVNALFWWSQGPLSLIALTVSQSPRVLAEGLGWEGSAAIENLSLHLPFLAGDLLLFYGLFSLFQRFGAGWTRRGLLAWALVPGFWWITAGHGQFDPWVPATVLLAVIAATDGRWLRAGLWLGLGFGFKYVPVVLMPGFLLLGWRRGRLASIGQLSAGFVLVAAASIAPLFITAFSLGLRDGAALLWDRMAWWSVGTESVLSSSALAGAVSSPYPMILRVLRSGGAAGSIEYLPPILVGTGVLATLGWYLAALRPGRSAHADHDSSVRQLLSYSCLTLLIVGGLGQVAVIQRLYWAAPLLLALSAVRDSRFTFGAALMYSFLFLLPEWFTTSPLLYLRPPLLDAAPGLAADVGSFTGWGRSPDLAMVIGALLVPMGIVAVLGTSVPRLHAGVALAALAILGLALVGLALIALDAALLTAMVSLGTLAVVASLPLRQHVNTTVTLLGMGLLVSLILVLGANG